MKLKKIASLMLAGVMAVSMLAGCQNANVDPEEPTDEPDVVVSDATNMLYNELSGSAKARVDAVANADLDEALADAADKYWDYNSGANYDVLTNVTNPTRGPEWNASKALSSAMGADFTEFGKYDHNRFGCKCTNFYANNTSEKSMVTLYVVNASDSDAYVMEMLADEIDRDITNLPEATHGNIHDDYVYSYTVSASIATKTVNFAGVDMGIKYVAVYVTQTPTENA